MHTVKWVKVRGGEYQVLLDGKVVGRVFRTYISGWSSDRRRAAWEAVPIPYRENTSFYEDTRSEATEQLIGWLTRTGVA